MLLHKFISKRFVLGWVLVTAVLALSVQTALPQTESETPRPAERVTIPYLETTEEPLQTDQTVAATDLVPHSKLVFQSYRDLNWEIYSGNDDTTGQTRLTTITAADIHPRFNRGLTRIVFASKRYGNYEIFTMNPDGTGVVQLTNNSSDDGNPYWSPDGSRIVFEAYRDGQAEIYVMNADGSGQTRLTSDGDFDGYPYWSQDGSKIAFTSRRTGGYRIYSMNIDGSGLVQLSEQPYSFNASWSPDGTQIAYDADADGDGWQELWLMNADGSNQHLIVDPSGTVDTWARDWSPDGRYIAFTLVIFTNYQGNWYWTNAYLHAYDSVGHSTYNLSLYGLDWHPDWQTADAVAPQTTINPSPVSSPLTGFTVSWSVAQDNLSGLRHYEVQYRDGLTSPWQPLVTTKSTLIPFPLGETDHIYQFRVRAVDNVFNIQDWSYDNTSYTTIRPNTFLGQRTDNRGVPVASSTVNISPTPLMLDQSEKSGFYGAQLAEINQYNISITSGSYAPLPDASLLLTDSMAFNFVLPPSDNMVIDGGFESGNFGNYWMPGGSEPPILPTNGAGHTGDFALSLGDPPHIPNLDVCVRPVGDMGLPACPYHSIEEALASASGADIWIFPGTYNDNATLWNGTTLQSVAGPFVTIIDVQSESVAISINSDTIFTGFTVQNGYTPDGGAAISVSSNPNENITIKNNLFISNIGANYTGNGGAVGGQTYAKIINNLFVGNFAYGGIGNCIDIRSGDPLIANNIFWNNGLEGSCINSLHGRIYNNVFVGNSGGIDSVPVLVVDIRNNIIVNSTGTGYGSPNPCPNVAAYNNVWGNNPNYYDSCNEMMQGNGNTSLDPGFVNSTLGNFRLQDSSQLRNLGDPALRFNDLDGSRNDMGIGGGPWAINKNNTPLTPTWSHAWYDLSTWSGEKVTLSFLLKDNLSGTIRSGVTQTITITEDIVNPTLSFLYQTGNESTIGNESFVVTITPESGQPTEFIVESNSNSQLWVYLDEVTVGSAYPDVWVSTNGVYTADPGERVVYELTYGNQSSIDVSGSVMTFTLPTGITFEETNLIPVLTSPLVWELGDLLAESGPFSIIVTATVANNIPAFTLLPSTAVIATPTTELETLNNVAVGQTFIGRFTYLPVVFKN